MKFVAIILLCSLFAYCSKGKRLADNAAKNSSLLMGTWKVTSIVSDAAYDWDGNGTAETDYYATLTACNKDWQYSFYASGQSLDRMCNDTLRFTWKLIENGAEIQFAYQYNDPFPAVGYAYSSISSISDSILVLKWNVTSPSNASSILQGTFKKQ